ncbi:uncharacterized protein [Henckelia pumila]|uniref:uncharacterized protein n=1 Tax=Henckelia pumila TaxID=405737 RepID=UPI003C6E9CEE
MTMFSAQKRGFSCCYVGGGGGYAHGFGTAMNQLQAYDHHHNHCNHIEACVGGSDPISVMAEEEESRIDNEGSTSKDNTTAKEEGDDDGGWLRLGIGIGSHSHETKQDEEDQKRREPGPIELELMPSNTSTSIPPQSQNMMRLPEFRTPRTLMNFGSGSGLNIVSPLQNTSTSSLPQQYQETNTWTNRNFPINTTSAAAASISILSSSPSLLQPPLMPSGTSYVVSRPFQQYMTEAAPGGVDITRRPAIDFRVIQPPMRPSSGLWLMLQASQNQEREPFLPQLSKSYLRIRDGMMTIRLVIKYLVIKLRLESETEIELTCKGQQLQPFLTLQHVRDNIWSSPRDLITLVPNSSTTDHIMVLHYARAARF